MWEAERVQGWVHLWVLALVWASAWGLRRAQVWAVAKAVALGNEWERVWAQGMAWAWAPV